MNVVQGRSRSIRYGIRFAGPQQKAPYVSVWRGREDQTSGLRVFHKVTFPAIQHIHRWKDYVPRPLLLIRNLFEAIGAATEQRAIKQSKHSFRWHRMKAPVDSALFPLRHLVKFKQDIS